MNDPLAEFAGKARLFPLPNLVFFPHVMQPLHIFEPRYRQMTADALDGDRFIAMVLPLPGWEKDYAGAPALHPIGCIGKITADQKLDDGRFNLLLRGLARVKIVSEVSTKKLYRTARIEILDEEPLTSDKKARLWRHVIFSKVSEWFPNQSDVVDQFRKLLESDLSLGILCDIMTFALPIDVEFKQTLLEELDVESRLTKLMEFLEERQIGSAALQRKFPPEFSVN